MQLSLGAQILLSTNMYWQVASFAHSATFPWFAYVSNLVPDSSLCRAAAPRLHRSASTAAPCLGLLQLLLPECICFSCWSPFRSASAAAPQVRPLQLLLPDWVCFSCCSPIESASAAAPRLSLLQLLLPGCVCFSCCSGPRLSCVRFNCCSPIASACSPSCSGRFQPMPGPNILEVQ